MKGGATEKQVRYALILLGKAGYSTRFMDSKFKPWTTMKERSGTVQGWLASMDAGRISGIIDELKSKVGEE
jgi:hypothetical protein